MFTLFKSSLIRCQSCEEVGPSRVSRYYRFVFALILAVGVLALIAMESLPRGSARISEFLLFLMVAISFVLLSRYAHRCRDCGSGIIQKITR